MEVNIGILTVSDRCWNQEADDNSGTALSALVEEKLKPKEIKKHICPDEQEDIIDILKKWCDDEKLHLIFTTGGTGIAQRDVTPDAVKKIISVELPGMLIRIINESLKVTPLAMLSRPVCGIRGKTLIITFPGSSKAATECFEFVLPAISHALDLISNRSVYIEQTHSELQGDKNFKVQLQSGTPGSSFDKKSAIWEKSESSAIIPKVADRARISPYKLISVGDAQTKILSFAADLPPKKIFIHQALGFALAAEVSARESVPPFDASIKDGYAVRTEDGNCDRELIGQSSAGTNPNLEEVGEEQCMRISTGAPVPLGADAVIQVEDTNIVETTDDGEEDIIGINDPNYCIRKGQEIRPKGSDIAEGQLLFPKGQVLGPSEIGVLASAGVTKVLVIGKPVVAVLSTGNELQKIVPGEQLELGRIYDSNKPVLLSLLNNASFPTFDAGIAQDDPTELFKAIRNAFKRADILVTSGGVSMGEKDLLRPVLVADFGAEIHFAQVFMKPGKPTTFATCVFEGKRKLILGLPGNPVSSVVTSYLYLVPLCRKLSGFSNYQNTIISAELGAKFKLDPRPEYHRVTLSWDPENPIPVATSTGNQISSRLLSLNSAQALLILPPKLEEQEFLPKGSVVQAVLLSA